MVGRSVAAAARVPPGRAREPPRPALAPGGRHRDGRGRPDALRDVDLEVRPGELVGVAGISGNGQKELYEVALGLVAARRRHRHITGTRLASARGAQAAIALGAVGVPEDPITDAVVPGLDVLRARGPGRPALLPQGRRHRLEAGPRPPRRARPGHRAAGGGARTGGVARCRAATSSGSCWCGPWARPARAGGGRLRRCAASTSPPPGGPRSCCSQRRAEGAGVLLISEDLDELLALSDRIVVLHDGEIAGIVRPGRDRPLRDRPPDARRGAAPTAEHPTRPPRRGPQPRPRRRREAGRRRGRGPMGGGHPRAPS